MNESAPFGKPSVAPTKQNHSEWQRCPVCFGSGLVPPGFYSRQPALPIGTALPTREDCRTCGGRGVL